MPRQSKRLRIELPKLNLFEKLEPRQLLSAVDVTRFGAIPGDGRDDSAAVRSAIRAAAKGDVITFPAGTYNIGSTIELDPNLSFDGGKVATLISPTNGFIFHERRRGLKVSNFNVSGGLVNFDTYGNLAPGTVTIDWNTFTNVDGGGDVGATHGTIGAPGCRVDNLAITNNSFSNDGGAGAGSGMCINIWTGDNWNILNNSFVHVLGSIKSNNQGNTAHNINIVGNYFKLNRRHAVELQGCVTGFWFTDNYYEQPNISSDFHSNDSTFAFSLIYTATSLDQHVLRNYIEVPAPADEPDHLGPRLAFEVGENAEVTDNLVIGCGTFATAYGPNTMVHDNKIKDQAYGQGYAYGPNSNTSKFWNNNWDVDLKWDITRGRPGPGGSFTAGGTGSSGGDDTVDPTGGSTLYVKLTGTVIDSTRVRLSWTDGSSSETGWRIERSLDQATWQTYDTHQADVTSYMDKGLSAGTIYYYRIFAYGTSGDIVASNIIHVKTKGTAVTTSKALATHALDTTGAATRVLVTTTGAKNSNKNVFGDSLITL